MSALQEVYTLMNAVSLSGVSGDNPYTTSALDLRGGPQQRILQLNSVMARGVSAASQPDFKLEWAGGVTCDQKGTTPPLGDVFELFTDNPPLIATSAGVETLLVVPMPAIYTPFVRFRLTALSGSPADSVFYLWALCQVARA